MISHHRFVTTLYLCLLCAFSLRQSSARYHPLAVASVPFGLHRQTSRRQISSSRSNVPDAVLFASSTTTRSTKQSQKKLTTSTAAAAPAEQPYTVNYTDLGPVGRIIAGSVEVTVSTLLEYASGFFGGYFLGTITDVPRLLFRSTEAQTANTLWQESAGRLSRLNGKSLRWAKSWGGISAAFGGFRVLTKVVRGGREDEWNTVFSSMAAGAFFARTEGPVAMARAAVLYGGMMYVLSGNMLAKKEPFEYQEQAVEF